MKLKSLLLGSAAVFVAVSGARAADAIVVEPEPVEYVRVCDAYGAGWYYIPGTETCLKFAGQLRVTYDVRTYDHVDNIENHTDSYRFRFHVYANNETEYGTLSSWVRYTTANADQGEATNPVIIDNAVISLAGFRIGRLSDSYWDNTGGAFFTNGTRSPATFAFYGATAAWFADYTWAANGWTATFGVQDPTNDSAFAASTIGRPDLYAGITYEASGLGLRGVVAYDSGTSWSDGGLAWKGGFTYDMGSGYSLGAWYGSDDGETDYIGGHIWGVTAKMNLMENVSLAGYFSQFDDQINDGTASAWGAELRWDIVPGLDITVGWEKVYGDEDNSILGGYDSVDAFRLAFTRRF